MDHLRVKSGWKKTQSGAAMPRLALGIGLAVGLGLIAALGLGSGCSRLGKLGECRELSQTVNDALTEIESIEKRSPRKATDYREAAADYSRLAKQLKLIHWSSSALAEEVAHYTAAMERAAQASLLLAAELDGKAAAGGEPLKIFTEVKEAQKNHRTRIESICRGH